MRALAVTPGQTTIALVDRPEPHITEPDHIKLRTIAVGVCGTDRGEVAEGKAVAEEGARDLVLGHELIGEVVEVGKNVRAVRPGDHATFTVRRECGNCLPCFMGRSDMCRTGDYRERGIVGLDGFQAEYIVDREQYVVRVPQELGLAGVLTEPLSIVEKGIDEALRVQAARLPDAGATPLLLYGRRCLVAGLGPVGLLAALALRLRGAAVFGLDVVDEKSARPQWLAGIGGQYIDGRSVHPENVEKVIGPVDLLFEATGRPGLTFNLLDALGPDGMYIVSGIPEGHDTVQIAGADLMTQLVVQNQVMMGTVNAARDHFQLAVHDLSDAQRRWGEHLAKLITHRVPPAEAEPLLRSHPDDEIKAVVDWRQAARGR